VVGVAAANLAEDVAELSTLAMASFTDWVKRLVVGVLVGAAEGAPERTKWGEQPPHQEQPAEPRKPGKADRKKKEE
jgi:hypothetical protein